MYEINYLIVLATGFIPLIVGFIWYNPKVLGSAWMHAGEMTEEKMKNANMPMIFGISLILSFMLAVQVNFMAIHQNHVFSMMMNVEGFGTEGSDVMVYLAEMMENYGREFRTFKHGALHGFIGGLMIAFPILATNALFERKSWKYIWINSGYWIVCMMLMGGVICQWA